MALILAIDDEPIYHKMISHALKTTDYELKFVADGINGLAAAKALTPDVIITDVMLPDIDGYEVTRRLRKDPRFAHTPIIVLTSQLDIRDKLDAFEAGADDYMSKPFEPEELVARLGVWITRSQAIKTAKVETRQTHEARVMTVHSLRGGLGTSSIAVNLAASLWETWKKPTLLVDSVLTAGQVALMLNVSLKRTWDSLSEISMEELEYEVIQSVVGKHESGLNYLASPTTPIAAEMIKPATIQKTLDILHSHYEYIVIDVPHNFSEISMIALDISDMIYMVMAPEMASVRASSAALSTYKKLGYADDKIKIIMNNVFEVPGLDEKKIEKALGIDIDYFIDYSPANFIRSINFGKPVVYLKPNDPVSNKLEDIAYDFSKEEHRNFPPESPTEKWQQINERMVHKRK